MPATGSSFRSFSSLMEAPEEGARGSLRRSSTGPGAFHSGTAQNAGTQSAPASLLFYPPVPDSSPSSRRFYLPTLEEYCQQGGLRIWSGGVKQPVNRRKKLKKPGQVLKEGVPLLWFNGDIEVFNFEKRFLQMAESDQVLWLVNDLEAARELRESRREARKRMTGRLICVVEIVAALLLC